MPRHKRGSCKDCGKFVGKKNLSNKNFCYDCAKKRMVDAFNSMWNGAKSRIGQPQKGNI